MQKDYIYSVAVHIVLFLIITFHGVLLKNKEYKYYKKVYKVDLISVDKAKPERKLSVPSQKSENVVPKKVAKRPIKEEEKEEENPRRAEIDSILALVEQKEREKEKKQSFAGGSIKLDVENFEYLYYLSIIQTKIQNNWKPPVMPGASGSKTVIYFKIKRNGQIVDIKKEESSGKFLLDQSALRAVNDSNPFPPLPEEFKSSFLGVHFEFEYIQ